jgi:hypothetical protein
MSRWDGRPADRAAPGVDDDDYEVGYGKPPKSAQFKKGQSGNPSGRPKDLRKLQLEPLERVLTRTMPVSINGKKEKMSLLEAIAYQQVNSALSGDAVSARAILKQGPKLLDKLAAREEAREELSEEAMGSLLDGILAMAFVEEAMMEVGLIFKTEDGNTYVNRGIFELALEQAGKQVSDLKRRYSFKMSTPEIEAGGISPPERSALAQYTARRNEDLAAVEQELDPPPTKKRRP